MEKLKDRGRGQSGEGIYLAERRYGCESGWGGGEG